MIAMRGLTIAAGKQEISKSILETFLQSVDRGMLPNRFPIIRRRRWNTTPLTPHCGCLSRCTNTTGNFRT